MDFVHEEPGWYGAFTREQAAGALLNGTRVVKVSSEPHDSHYDGELGTIVGSLAAGSWMLYFIEWDRRLNVPLRCAVATASFKVRAINSNDAS